MRPAILAALLIMLMVGVVRAQDPLQPFVPDANTILLYHLDEGSGEVARDGSGRGQDGALQGAQWARGRFGGGLWFDGTDDSVFLQRPDALRGLKQITVECWFNQEATWGRRFLMGHDVGFHFEVDDNVAASISLYNQGGGVPNADGEPHRQVLLGGLSIRPGRWHHLAITYNGRVVSYFLDGVLKGRRDGPKDFAVGAESRGLWLGCYVGMDYYFGGLLDEVRVSDVVRYDPEGRLQPGERVFAMPEVTRPLRAAPMVRTATKTGAAGLKLSLRKLHGGEAKGWVCLKPPGRPAAIVGEYALPAGDGQMSELVLDVSDEYIGDGSYLLGLVPTVPGYYALTSAQMTAGGKTVASWDGEAKSRVTFRPPVLVALKPPSSRGADASIGAGRLLPQAADWASGALELDAGEDGQPPLVVGDGLMEWWLDLPKDTIYRVHLRYAAAAPRPCDIVIDGEDLNDYDMCALNTTGRGTARDAFWEYQGTVKLKAGVHWLRLQDVLPDIVGLWLEPTDKLPARKVPWARFPEWGALLPTVSESPNTLRAPEGWRVPRVFGQATGKLESTGPEPLFTATFANTDPASLFAGDRVRFICPGSWDLEPFGRLDFTFQGTGSGHVAALWAVDAKGDEKLLWRLRDTTAEPVAVQALLNFEGNDVFDPARVVALCLDLDEGNEHPTRRNTMAVSISNLGFVRRDAPAGGRTRQGAMNLRALAAPFVSPGFRPWTQPVIPEEHPLYATTEPKPVTRATLGYNLRFCGARDVSAAALKQFHDDYDFGDINWPHIGILPQRRDFKNDADYAAALRRLEERVQDVRQRGLILWDIWGYVPFGEAGPTPRVAPEHHEILTRVLGDRFLGYDNGEQDGRYIGGYSDRGSFTDRRGGWEDFVKWDTGICDDSMNYMNATGSLNFSHYYGERGARMLGLETAQGLPSDTLMFAFLRGAGKQYGRLTYQATSIWSRFGYNMYHERRTEGGGGYGLGPHKGCSLSLHRRLFLQSFTGGDSIVGSETAQFTGDQLPAGKPELSPLGKQHLAVRQWADQHPDRGVMYTPVAFMLDFYHGWNMPRHLYRADKYKVWGKLPYEKGDYAIDQVFRLVWPGYEDCSYLRNERGFITPTPYGDIFDVVTNRCRPEILKQYTTLMLLGDVEITAEVAANLQGFVEQGGDLWLGAGNARQLPETFTGVRLGDQGQATRTTETPGTAFLREQPYTYTMSGFDGAEARLVNEHDHPVLTVNSVGKGRVFVCLADHYVTDKLEYAEPKLVNMEPPHRLLRGVERVLDGYFRSFSPVRVSPEGLNLRVNCYEGDPKRFLVALTNNELFADWEGKVSLPGRTVVAAKDLRADKALTPAALAKVKVPAGDVVLVDVRVK